MPRNNKDETRKSPKGSLTQQIKYTRARVPLRNVHEAT